MVGNKPLTKLEGINSVASERLSEEGMDTVQRMAMCNVHEIHSKTKFHMDIIIDWRVQAILYLVTGDVEVKVATNPGKNCEKMFLYDRLTRKAGIRTFYRLLEIWQNIKKDVNKQKSLFLGLGLLDSKDENSEYLYYMFEGIIKQGHIMKGPLIDSSLRTVIKT